MVQGTVALRVDVDTRRGLREGVPRLLELFRRAGVRASFFVTMGPDRSGLAIRRAWRPGFLAKMWRTRALSLYGLGTVLSGTLLPARPVGAGAGPLLRQIADEGHEVAPHGFDHVRWQDRVHRLDAADVRRDLAAAAEAFRAIFGASPRASAAPGWRTTTAALAIQDELGLRYASDVRGATPFRPALAREPATTVQIPTTMPTVDELLGRVRDIPAALGASVAPGLNVFTLHAEVEGGALLAVFAEFLSGLLRRGIRPRRLDDVAEDVITRGDLPALAVGRGTVRGRSGWVAMAPTSAGAVRA